MRSRLTAAPVTVRVLTRATGGDGPSADTISPAADPDPCGLSHPLLHRSSPPVAQIQDPFGSLLADSSLAALLRLRSPLLASLRMTRGPSEFLRQSSREE